MEFLQQSAFFCEIISMPPPRRFWGLLAALAPVGQIIPQGIGYVLRYGQTDHIPHAEQLGMDDFISSPIDHLELIYRLKRIHTLFSHSGQPDLHLSRMANSILHILRSSRGRPVERAVLYELCSCDPSSRRVDMCISRLRKHLSEQGSVDRIISVRGKGYILV